MKLEIDDSTLESLIERVVVTALARVEADQAKVDGRLAFTESEAAAVIGVRPHVLRDARRRGELQGVRVGKRILIEREELNRFLVRQRLK